MRPTDHPVVALVGHLTPLDLEQVAVAADADVVLVGGVQFLGALVPGQGNLWVVDLDLALKHRLLVGEDGLIRDVPHHGDGLRGQQDNQNINFSRTILKFDINQRAIQTWIQSAVSL